MYKPSWHQARAVAHKLFPNVTPRSRMLAPSLFGCVVFVFLLLVVRFAWRFTLDQSVRAEPTYKIWFFYSQVGFAVVVQMGVAGAAAWRDQRRPILHGLAAAFVTGCLAAATILIANLFFGGSIDATFTWLTFEYTLLPGMIGGLLSAGFAALARPAHRPVRLPSITELLAAQGCAGIADVRRGDLPTLLKPFGRLEELTERVVDRLNRWAFLELLQRLGTLSIAIGAVQWWVGRETARLDKAKASHYAAWQVINSAQGRGGSAGRIDALQDLVRDRVSLAGISLEGAWLHGVQVPGAFLHGAHLRNAALQGANSRWSRVSQGRPEGRRPPECEPDRCNPRLGKPGRQQSLRSAPRIGQSRVH